MSVILPSFCSEKVYEPYQCWALFKRALDFSRGHHCHDAWWRKLRTNFGNSSLTAVKILRKIQFRKQYFSRFLPRFLIFLYLFAFLALSSFYIISPSLFPSLYLYFFKPFLLQVSWNFSARECPIRCIPVPMILAAAFSMHIHNPA
jgi:hypothetical protein